MYCLLQTEPSGTALLRTYLHVCRYVWGVHIYRTDSELIGKRCGWLFFFFLSEGSSLLYLQKHHAIASEAADATTLVIACHTVKKTNLNRLFVAINQSL